MQKEITAAIEKDATLNGEITQLSSLKCDCGNENTSWNFPILCMLLIPILIFLIVIQLDVLWFFHIELPFLHSLTVIIGIIGTTLNCVWA
jgi:hypothetical protein